MPRLFVGQVPTTCSEEDLVPVFAPYGEIEKVSLVRGPDHKSRGCCMVRWGWLAARVRAVPAWPAAESHCPTLCSATLLHGCK